MVGEGRDENACFITCGNRKTFKIDFAENVTKQPRETAPAFSCRQIVFSNLVRSESLLEHLNEGPHYLNRQF
jgi:hypothetical protein